MKIDDERLAESVRAMVVYCNLDDAHANGQFAVGGNLRDATATDIAQDLKSFAADCEDIDLASLEKYVKLWLQVTEGIR